MSTINGNMKSFKVTDPQGNVYILMPVDTEVRQAIDEARNLQFDNKFFKTTETSDEVDIENSVTQFGVTPNTPLRIDQDDENGLLLGSDALYSVSACASVYNSVSGTYSQGVIVTHLGKLYKCTTTVSSPEVFDPSKWTEVHLVDLINDIKSNVIVKSDLKNLIMDNYDSTDTYEVGDYCIHEKVLYRCLTAITTAEAWNSSHWTAVHDILSESKKIKVISNAASDDSTSGTVHTSVIYPNTYKEITIADTITELVIELSDPIIGVMQQTGFQFTLGSNSILSNVEVHRGNYKLPIAIGPTNFIPGKTYQGNITNGCVTIEEFDQPTFNLIGYTVLDLIDINGVPKFIEFDFSSGFRSQYNKTSNRIIMDLELYETTGNNVSQFKWMSSNSNILDVYYYYSQYPQPSLRFGSSYVSTVGDLGSLSVSYLNTRLTLDYNKGIFKLGDYTKSGAPYGLTEISKLQIGGNRAAMKLYGVKIISDDGVTIIDAVPVSRDSDNKSGLYDIISSEFHALN